MITRNLGMAIFGALTVVLAGQDWARGDLENRGPVETLVSCEEDDGDQWFEIGVGLADGPGLELYEVRHNEDNGRATLTYTSAVEKTKLRDNRVVYENAAGTVRLMVNESKYRGQSGRYTRLIDGPGSLQVERLQCFTNSSISWDR